jgi:hypothetical protein
LVLASDGFVQCYEPDDSKKTCHSIAIYKAKGDGTYANTAIVLLAPHQAVTLETVTLVQIKNEAVCGFVRNNDLLTGKLRLSGQLLPDDRAAPILAKIAAAYTPFLDKEICTEYVAGADGLIAKVRIEGSTSPVPDQRVKWVRPADGYIVAPILDGGSPTASGS